LKKISQAMLDKAHTIPIDKIGKTIGKLSKKDMLQINQGLALFLGLGWFRKY